MFYDPSIEKKDSPGPCLAAVAVFSAVMAHPELIPVLHAALALDDFAPESQPGEPGYGERVIWQALLDMGRRGIAINPMNVMLHMARRGHITALGLLPDLEKMVVTPPTMEGLEKAVAYLRRRGEGRRVEALLEELIEIGMKHRASLGQAVAAIQARMQPLLAERARDYPEEAAGGQSGVVAPVAARALLADPDPAAQPVWLLDRLLPAGGVSLLAGEVASGKTFLALDLAIAVAAAFRVPEGMIVSAWDGRACLGGPVLYCCLDSNPRTIRRRVQVLCAGRAIDPPEDLFFDFSPLNLALPEDQQRFLRMVKNTLPPGAGGLVVLDVLARYLPGLDENSVAAVGPVFTLLRRVAAQGGISVLVVHHFNKSVGAVGATARMQRVRGSSDIVAAVDAALSVTLSGSRDHPRRTVTPEKNRELPEEPPFDFALEPAAGGGLVLRFTAPPPPPPEDLSALLAAVQEQVLQMLRARPQAMTRAEIEAALKAAWQGQPALSDFALNRFFSNLAACPELVVGRAGRMKTYRWQPA